MSTVTLRDVELVSAGTWAASTGPTTIDRAALDAILAAAADGVVDRAPVKFGHRSNLNDGIGDGAPAYGWVTPTRVVEKGRNGLPTLIGDIVGIPSKLAEAVRNAYPRRSAEIVWDVKTHAGHTYRAALRGLALLGAQAPAVKGLADVAALYAEQADLDGDTTEVLLVDDAGERLALLAETWGAPDASHIPHPVPTSEKDDDMPQNNTAPAIDEAKMREALGLAADADLAAALDAYRGTLDKTVEAAAVVEQPTPGTVNPDAEPVPAAAPAAEPVPGADPAKVDAPPAPQSDAAAVEPGTVTLSAAVYGELTALAEANRRDRRERAVDDAIRAGKITPAERPTYLAAMNSDEQTTTTLLAGLAPKFVTVPSGDPNASTLPTDLEAALDRWAETGEL